MKQKTEQDMRAVEAGTGETRVWDPLVRIFHWSLVLFFTIAYLSGEEASDLHIYSGYVILGLITFRLIWGFIGSRHARFSDFVRSPKIIIEYTKSMLSGHPKRYLGHNPAGGAMIVALLLGLAVTTYSGLKVYAIEEGAGPLARSTVEVGFIRSAYADDDDHGYDRDEKRDGDEGSDEASGEDFWEEIHEASANFVLFLVVLHIFGVVVSGRMHDENLVKAMLSGNKKTGM